MEGEAQENVYGESLLRNYIFPSIKWEDKIIEYLREGGRENELTLVYKCEMYGKEQVEISTVTTLLKVFQGTGIEYIDQ